MASISRRLNRLFKEELAAGGKRRAITGFTLPRTSPGDSWRPVRLGRLRRVNAISVTRGEMLGTVELLGVELPSRLDRLEQHEPWSRPQTAA
ncbi:hypothetical protein Cadr_000027752 [Camelus dromedarius]|uniref:Uncharacterized protein n=1 Tax=Camelus dromedarius TaxID=9838 RepID=A0A5N4CBU2_CAMDR|nr:hypothetical protein Cadr_000027752 [Camelus dromedarius]